MMFILAWLISIVGAVVIADRKNLNIPLFFFLSIFLGPVALFIAAVSSPRSRSGGMASGPLSAHEARTQLEGIKTTLRLLQDRVDRLEASLTTGTGAPSDPEPAPAGQPYVKPEPAFVDAKVHDPKVPEAWEFIFGKYWLNRIGVVLFVVGIGLFINYTFHYFSAYMKIAIGYFFAILFLVWGQRLEKNPRFNKLAWGILGGAWGLFYLVTYAMHYVPATRVITSSFVELVLLWLVTVCAVQYNLKYRSWIATAMSYFLGFMTMAIGGVDASSVFFWAMLIGSLSFLAFKFNWDELLMTGIIGAYAMYALALRPQVIPFRYGTAVTPEEFQIVMGLLVTAWAVFFGTILAKEWKKEVPSSALLPWILLNTSAFVLFGLKDIGQYQPFNTDFKFYFLILVAGAHALAAAGNRLFKKPAMVVAHCAFAIALASLAVVIRYKQLGVSFWWIAEMLMLFGLGVYYKEILYRFMGCLLGVGVTLRFFIVDISSSKVYAVGPWSLQHDILVAAVIAACFFTMGLWISRAGVKETLAHDERDFYFYSFPAAGALVLTAIMADDSPARWLTLHWTLLGLGLLVGGFFLKNRALRFSALGVLVLACVRIFFYDLAGADTIYKIIVVIFLGAALLGVSFIYSRIKQNN